VQSEFQFDRDEPIFDTIRSWLSPTGRVLIDGVRLAVINSIFLFGSIAFAFVAALLVRLVRIFLPVPAVNPGLLILVLSVIFGLIVWYRYASRHRDLAQATGRSVNPDRFGAIAGAPFALLGLLLLASGLFGLAISVAGPNFGGVGAAVGRLIFAVLFGLLAVGSVGVARFAMRGSPR